jgi:predicted transcriptional regulator
MDLEAFRTKRELSYAQLAELIEVSQAKQARAYALGHAWPRSEQLQKILKKTRGAVTVEAMHAQRLSFLEDHHTPRGRPRSERRVA